ncbi:MAG: hypothetical protein KA760_11550 [Steroidobacteraceae bacterium]|nr:hypothetical protein [Steroidobacteraceae bacterium]
MPQQRGSIMGAGHAMTQSDGVMAARLAELSAEVRELRAMLAPPSAVILTGAEVAELAKFDPRSKVCSMNCGPHAEDPRSEVERMFLCPECHPVEADTMKPHLQRELVNRLTDIARQFHGAEQLRDRIAHALGALLEEAEETRALRERMADLLSRTAVALRGPEPPLTRWSWHDLPERAAAAIAAIDVMQRAAQAAAAGQQAQRHPTVEECEAAGRGPDNGPGNPFECGGLPDTPEERARFEAYLRGHCWTAGDYDTRRRCYPTTFARMLYGMWRDRGALPTVWPTNDQPNARNDMQQCQLTECKGRPRCARCTAQDRKDVEAQLPHAYLLAKLAMIMPLFQEARDALTAITEAQRRASGISATLADRMDAAGTYSIDDWRKPPPATATTNPAHAPRPGSRTWGDGERCAECCNGDRCDDPTHHDRNSKPGCPHCLNTGWALWTEAGREAFAKYRGWASYRADVVAAERAAALRG